MPKMYSKKTNKTAALSVVNLLLFLALSISSFAGSKIDVTISKKSYNGSDVSCYQASDAQLTITATGGNGGYTYSIDNGVHFQSGNVFSNLAGAQNYVVVVKDSKGQTSKAEWVWVSTVANPVTISSANTTASSCGTANDGQISLSAYGGTGAIEFSIDNGATWQASGTFKNLSPHIYTVIARDINGCTSDSKVVYVSSGGGVLGVIDYKEDYNCNWGNGSVKVRGSNGKAPYQYSIDGLPYVSSGNFSNLKPGDHTVVIVDSKGCTGSVNFEIKATVEATLSGDTTIMTGGTAKLYVNIVDASSQNANYTLTLIDDKGGNYTYNNLREGINTINTGIISDTRIFTISAIISSRGCNVYPGGSAEIKVEKNTVWLGLTKEWNENSNWSNGKVPTANSDVLIGETANNPVISDEGSVQSITIIGNATLEIAGHLRLTGTITGTQGGVIATEGTIEFDGTTKQGLDGKIFSGKSIANMEINNDVELTDSLNVYGLIEFDAEGKNLYTNDLLTLKSTAIGSAAVGNTSKNRIFGMVTVEDYIAPRRGWKFLSVPTVSGQTIQDAWQEGQSSNVNNLPGKGTQITGEMNDWQAKGFDAKAYSPSVKSYNSNTDSYVGIKSTLEPFSDTSNAYMIFVRGDRSANSVSATATATTLRTKGELRSGDQQIRQVQAGKYLALGNPYAAPLELNKIKTDSKMTFYFWDPELGDSYGAYQTVMINKNGKYTVIPGSAKMGRKSVQIVSGQAFYAYSINGGSLQITEDSKILNGYKNSNNRPMGFTGGTDSEDDELQIKLYSVANNNKSLVDGILQSFNGDYSNEVDDMDALKSVNTGENLSIKSHNKILAIESRQFSENSDTTQLNLTGVKLQNYRFEISLNESSNGKEAILVDRFNGIVSPLLVGKLFTYDFSVTNNAASYAADRFQIIFRPMAPLPVTFKGINAVKKQQLVKVNWEIDNEVNVKQYSVERSGDGVSFSEIGTIPAAKKSSYSFDDAQPLNGVNYYRVVSVDVDGKKGYSSVVNVVIEIMSKTQMNVYPNPVVGNNIHLRMNINTKGIYYLIVKNPLGQVIDSRKVNLVGGEQAIDIVPESKLATGVYTIEVTQPNGEQSVARFIR